MLATPDLRNKIAIALLFITALTLVSCASQKDTRLVKDPDEKYESTIPWNKQEKWESQGPGQLSPMLQGR